MSFELIKSKTDYRDWLGELKARFRQVQIKAVMVNTASFRFYWELGAEEADEVLENKMLQVLEKRLAAQIAK